MLGRKAKSSELSAFVDDFNNAYIDGFKYHQDNIGQRRELLEWVRRENYLDYTLPEIEQPTN